MQVKMENPGEEKSQVMMWGWGVYEGIEEGLNKVKNVWKSYLETYSFAICAKKYNQIIQQSTSNIKQHGGHMRVERLSRDEGKGMGVGVRGGSTTTKDV